MQEHSLVAVHRADIGGADATPERIKPRGGQVREYPVQPFLAPGGEVLHDNQPWRPGFLNSGTVAVGTR
jgi:hypothetical protein